MQAIQIESISFEEFKTMLQSIAQQQTQAGYLDICEVIPYLTKEQAAHALRGSTAHIDSLIRSGELEPVFPFKKRPATMRFRTEDVLALRRAGKTGRK